MKPDTWCPTRSRSLEILRSSISRRGFTLIELLIVIAIILILISIALPNFLEAQMRAKVAKVKGEIRSLALAMEQYNLDWKAYPAENEPDSEARPRNSRGLFWLTSPVKYISKIPQDPFVDKNNGGRDLYYETGGTERFTTEAKYRGCLDTWVIFTRGPDMQENEISSANPTYEWYGDSADSYSPTNGSKSFGDIFQYGGDPFWIGVQSAMARRSSYTPSLDKGLVIDHEFYLHRLPPKLR